MVVHTEETVGRAPVQIVEVQTQRCANSYGCAPCTAGLGAVDTSDLSVNFAQEGLSSFYDVLGFSTSAVRVAGGIRLTPLAANGGVRRVGSTGFSGSIYRYVNVAVTVHGDCDLSTATMWYGLSGLPTPSGFRRVIGADNLDFYFRGFRDLRNLKAGDQVVLVFDAARSLNYLTEWVGGTITDIRFGLGTDTSVLSDVTLHSITVSERSLFLERGGECYNTRATCQDLVSFRAVPDGHLSPTATLRDGDAITASSFDRQSAAFFVAEIRAGIDPDGTIFALGSSTNFAYLGITGSNLVFAAGGNAASTQARATVAVSTIAARTVTLVAEIDWDSDTVNLWEFDPLERELTLLATDAADTGLPASWSASTDGQVGGDGGNTYGTEDGGSFDGRIAEVRGHDGILFDGAVSDAFRLRQYFGSPTSELPADRDKVILPYLANVSTAPTKVSLGGANRNTDPIGNRASVNITMTDQPGSDLTDDPYLSDRPDDPLLHAGGFWAKWRVRQKFGRVGARLRVFEGYRGQFLSAMTVREYVFDKLNISSRVSVTLRGRDILSKAELTKSQVPQQSPGLLNADINSTATTIVIKNATVDDYPAPGTVRIDQELLTYSAVAVNGGDPSLIDLTVTSRGTDRSAASDHSEDDSVQLCRRYTAARVFDVLTEMLADDAEIDAQYLDLANWKLEDDGSLSAYTLTTVIAEPTSVAQLVGSLTESVAAFIYFDERDILVKLEALKALTETPPLLSDAASIVADSFSLTEKPREQATRVQLYYNPVTFASALRDPVDFLNGYIDADLSLEAVDAYGIRQIRTILSRWLTTNAQATQTASRLANRYQDVPVEVAFTLDAKDRTYWIGDVVRFSHYQLVDQRGARDTLRSFIITSAEEVVPGELIAYTAEDATLAGGLFVIAPNDQPDHGDPSDASYAFITDASGNQGDGLPGTRIR